jgi:predicted nicotinamide N-methyase
MNNPPSSAGTFDFIVGAGNIEPTKASGAPPVMMQQRCTSLHRITQELSLMLTEDPTLGVAGSVWDGGTELACELASGKNIGICKGQRVLELGAGVGVAGIAAAVVGANVVLTDLDVCVAVMQENIAHNQALIQSSGGSAEALALDWNHPPPESIVGKFDIILGADVSYHLEFAPPILRTIRALARVGTNIVFAHKPRNKMDGRAGEFDAAGDFPFMAETGWAETLEVVKRAETSWPGLYIYHLRVKAV